MIPPRRSSLRPSQGIGSKVPSRGFSRSLLSPKSASRFSGGISKKSMQKASPKKPGSIFEEKKYYGKRDLREKIRKVSPYILRGKMIPWREREKMVEQWFPHKRFGSYVKEGEVKRRLRELRGMEYRAKTGKEKKIYGTQRKLLEAFTGVRKY